MRNIVSCCLPLHLIFLHAPANNPNAPALPYFAVFIALWSAFVLKHWQRTVKYTALEWGMVGFEEEEEERPEFEGERVVSAVNGKVSLHFPKWKRFRRGVKGRGVTFTLVLVVLGIIACIFFIKYVINTTGVISYDMNGVITSLMLAILISLCNDPFQLLALRLVMTAAYLNAPCSPNHCLFVRMTTRTIAPTPITKMR
jgi:hypothetical protein